MKPARLVPLAVAVLAFVVGIALVPLFRDDGPGRGEAIVVVDGRARVTRAAGRSEDVTGRVRLRRGDLIEVEQGRAAFELADGVRYEARAGGAGRRAGTTVRMHDVPALLAGRLLVTADRKAVVSSAGTRIALNAEGRLAAMRLRSTFGFSVGVYQGDATLDSAGATLSVSSLRATEVAAAGDLARQADPLSYATDDRWDRRFLEPAILLDQAVQPLLIGFRSSGGRVSASAARLRASMAHPPSSRTFDRAVRARHDGGGALVGAAIVGSTHQGSFSERWRQTFALRDAGASWGIVALSRHADPQAVVDELSRALDSSEFAFSDSGDAADQRASGPPSRPRRRASTRSHPASPTSRPTPKPPSKPTPKPTSRPTPKPTSKPTPKPPSKPTSKSVFQPPGPSATTPRAQVPASGPNTATTGSTSPPVSVPGGGGGGGGPPATPLPTLPPGGGTSPPATRPPPTAAPAPPAPAPPAPAPPAPAPPAPAPPAPAPPAPAPPAPLTTVVRSVTDPLGQVVDGTAGTVGTVIGGAGAVHGGLLPPVTGRGGVVSSLLPPVIGGGSAGSGSGAAGSGPLGPITGPGGLIPIGP